MCMSVKLFHTKLEKYFFMDYVVILKQERAFPKLLPQHYKHFIALNTILCFTVRAVP